MALGTLNRVSLIGPLGTDPEIRRTQAGRKIAVMNIITRDPRTNRLQWHRCIVHNECNAEFIERHLRKGALVFVEGSLEVRKWINKDGTSENWTVEIAVHKVTALDWQRDNDRDFVNALPDDDAVPPTPRSRGKYGDDVVADTDDSGLHRFLAPDDHQRAERRAAGEPERRA